MTTDEMIEKIYQLNADLPDMEPCLLPIATRLAAQQLEISDLKTHVRDANKGARINSILAANVIADREKMRHQFSAQQQRIVELRNHIIETQWHDSQVHGEYCLICFNNKEDGHATECRKASLLKDMP